MADTGRLDVADRLERGRLVPVIVIEHRAAAEPLAAALVAGGLRCAEVTFRTEAAEAALRAMAQDSRLLVGAGTVVRPDQVERAVAAGAAFIVSPGFSPAVVRRCQELGVPVFPESPPPARSMSALEAGLDVVKFFPAEALGGVAMLKALAAPFPGCGSSRPAASPPLTCRATSRMPSVLAVGGSWMVAPELIAAGAWDEISRLTAEAVAIAGEA